LRGEQNERAVPSELSAWISKSLLDVAKVQRFGQVDDQLTSTPYLFGGLIVRTVIVEHGDAATGRVDRDPGSTTIRIYRRQPVETISSM
jgi:hypothetical protein